MGLNVMMGFKCVMMCFEYMMMGFECMIILVRVNS